MDNLQNIFNELKNHETQPPEFLSSLVFSKINEERDDLLPLLYPLASHNITPPSYLFDNINVEIQNKIFEIQTYIKDLKHHKKNPPAYLYDLIAQKIALLSSQAKVISISPFIKRVSVAAACVATITLGWLLFNSTKKNQSFNSNSIASVVAPLPKNEEDSIIDNSVKPVIKNKIFIASNTMKRSKKVFKKIIKKKVKPVIDDELDTEKPVDLLVGGVKLTFENNDFLATFINYNYTPESTLFNNIVEGQDLIIKVDKYSSVGISDKMQTMMKKMYALNINGKPTGKAKRAKKKLIKWQDADLKTFDLNNTKNPTDPVDLFHSFWGE